MGSTTIPATSKELQDRIQNGWWGFWPLAWTIGERKMRERTSAGWTYQEMLAHIAAWERATASRLARLRESGDFAGPPSGWTGKALLAHIARWLEGVPPELPVRLEGRRSPQPDVDAVNARSAEQAATLPARRSVERAERAYRAVRDAVRALPDGTLPLMVLRLVAGEMFNHFSEHDAELAALRPRTATELAARVDEAWRPVRERIREIGRGRMGELRPNGWTYKDLVGHIAAWEEYGERGIRDWRAGRFAEMSDADVDAFNAREVENRKLVGAEAILDELDTAHRRLVEIARTLTEDELRERIPLSLVAWDTYLHYPDHA